MPYSNKFIDDLMKRYESIMADDFQRYKNHVYRVFFSCIALDNEVNNQEKYAIAAVFHDIGIWTDHTFDYLRPSEEQARRYLTENNKSEWIEEITAMIHWHHKISSYHGKNEITVNTFRKADWIDVSLGLITFGYRGQQIKENRKRLPNLGFHFLLIREATKNFFKHPLNPLPMFKK